MQADAEWQLSFLSAVRYTSGEGGFHCSVLSANCHECKKKRVVSNCSLRGNGDRQVKP